MESVTRKYTYALNEVDCRVRFSKNPEYWMRLWIGLRDEKERLEQEIQRKDKVIHLKNFTERPA